jgi:hypothetical protein
MLAKLIPQKFIYLFAIIISMAFTAKSQDSSCIPLIFSISDNGSVFPGTGYLGIISHPLHPGLSVGTYKVLREKPKSSLYHSIQLGGYYHKYNQTAIKLYTELIYRYKFVKRFSIDPQIMVGYLLSIPDIQVFEFKNGSYEKITSARSQFIAGANLGLSYDLRLRQPARIFLAYQFCLQMPYINNYVPMVPVTSLSLGFVYHLNRSCHKNKVDSK